MGVEYPTAPLPSAHALIRQGERFLLVERARAPLQGHWGLPGGGVALGETVAEAAIREVFEETGLEVAISRFLGYIDSIERDETGRVRYHYVIFYVEAEVVGGSLRPADDARAVRWMSLTEAAQYPLTDAVTRCLSLCGLIDT